MKMFDKGSDQNFRLKFAPKLESSGKEEVEDGDEDDNDDKGSQEKEKMSQDSVQIGTPLPDVDLVKELLQTGTATDSYQSAHMPLMAISQPALQQSSAFPLQQPPQQRIPSGVYPQLGITQADVNHYLPFQSQSMLGNTDPSLGSQANIFPNGNANLGGTIDSSVSVQPVILNPSLLSQAILGTGKFQRSQKAESKDSERKHVNPLGSVAESSELHSDSSPAFPAQGPVSTSFNDITSFQAGPLNPGVTPSMPILPVPLRQQTEVQDSTPPQFQSLLPPAMRLPVPRPWRTTQHHRKPQFEDEYKYDRWDQQGIFLHSFIQICPSS